MIDLFAIPTPLQRRSLPVLLSCFLAALPLSDLSWTPGFGRPGASTAHAQRAAAPRSAVRLDATKAERVYARTVEKHWVPSTGLFLSWNGTGDNKLSQEAATYDEAVIGMLALEMRDWARARPLFDFYRKAWYESAARTDRPYPYRGVANFYNAFFGNEGIEKIIHTGPNAWIGMFIARYAARTGDPEAKRLAIEMGHWMAGLYHRHGLVSMGPATINSVPWREVFSTENNLSAIAFYADIEKLDITPGQRAFFARRREKLERAVIDATFVRSQKLMLRGYNPAGPDRTQALDTYTWLIMTLGPDRLEKEGFFPEEVMDLAESRFGVEVGGEPGYDTTDALGAERAWQRDNPGAWERRPDGDGHRMIWYEGFAHHLINVMERIRYYETIGASRPEAAERIAHYKARYAELSAAFDRSERRGAYITATRGRYYPDGWPPPADGASGPPSSLVTEAWRAFIAMGYNPMTDSYVLGRPELDRPSRAQGVRTLPKLLWGDSSSMAGYAWRLYERGRFETSLEQATVTINEWVSWAQDLQKEKAKQVGGVIYYDETWGTRQRISDYWALNDVASAYYVRALALERLGRTEEALSDLRIICERLSLAQIWDTRGWFWSPPNSIAEEFILAQPEKYAALIPVVEPLVSEQVRGWLAGLNG